MLKLPKLKVTIDSDIYFRISAVVGNLQTEANLRMKKVRQGATGGAGEEDSMLESDAEEDSE